MKELRVRLIRLHEAKGETADEKLSDLLPLLERHYDRPSYRLETEKRFKPETGKTLALGRGFTLEVEAVDGAELNLRLRGRRAREQADEKPLRMELQRPLSHAVVIGPFQGRSGEKYLLALTPG